MCAKPAEKKSTATKAKKAVSQPSFSRTEDGKIRFEVVLEGSPHMETAAIVAPFSVQEVFGTRARVPVRGTINGFAFRSSLVPMGGRHMTVVNKAMRTGASVKAGDRVAVVLERDSEPRTIEAPPDLAKALAKNANARAAWDKYSYTHRKEFARWLEEAKKEETRARRLEKTLEMLALGTNLSER